MSSDSLNKNAINKKETANHKI